MVIDLLPQNKISSTDNSFTDPNDLTIFSKNGYQVDTTYSGSNIPSDDTVYIH